MAEHNARKHELGKGTLGPLENGFPDPDKTVTIAPDLEEHGRRVSKIRIFGGK